MTLIFNNLAIVERLLDQQIESVLKPALVQATSTKIVALFHLDFIPRLLRLAETSKPTETLLNTCQLIFSSVHLFAKLQAHNDDFEADTLFMLNTLNNLTVTGLVSDNLKFQTVTLLASLSQHDITNRRPNVSSKFIETLCLLITDPNLLVVNQSLQCLVDFLQFSPANNAILSDLIRSPKLDTDAKLQIDLFIKETPIQVDKSEKEILRERNARLLERALEGEECEERSSAGEENLEEEIGVEEMDETMNLLCAMDTTMASQGAGGGSQRQRREREEMLVEEARNGLDEVFVRLAGGKRSEWMREELNKIWQGKMEAL